jgi:hypothetical protein
MANEMAAFKVGNAEQMDKLEVQMLALPQTVCSVRHLFTPGQYTREVTIPADSYIVGHKHRHPHLNIFTKGSGVMVMCDGRHQELQAPFVFVGQPGRKCGYARTEVVWLNVFATEERDIEKLEEMYFDKSEEFVEAQSRVKVGFDPLMLTHQRSDYAAVLAERNVPEAYARAVSENADDMIPLPFGAYKVKIGPSLIEGRGVIATADIGVGEIIGAARIGDKRTPLGRYANHSQTANAKFVNAGDRIILVALRPITGCRGGFDGEEVTVNYRDAIAMNLQIGAQS